MSQALTTAPSIAETKAIAEEGFIYGLPLVMNYAVMYEFAVDSKSSQFKAPFNRLHNMHHVATYEDTAVVTPNSDTPYTTLWLDLRAEPIVISALRCCLACKKTRTGRSPFTFRRTRPAQQRKPTGCPRPTTPSIW